MNGMNFTYRTVFIFRIFKKLYPSNSCNNLIEPEVRKLFVGVKVAIQKYIVHYQRKICDTAFSFERTL